MTAWAGLKGPTRKGGPTIKLDKGGRRQREVTKKAPSIVRRYLPTPEFEKDTQREGFFGRGAWLAGGSRASTGFHPWGLTSIKGKGASTQKKGGRGCSEAASKDHVNQGRTILYP